jgi:hypothetical protein
MTLSERLEQPQLRKVTVEMRTRREIPDFCMREEPVFVLGGSHGHTCGDGHAQPMREV